MKNKILFLLLCLPLPSIAAEPNWLESFKPNRHFMFGASSVRIQVVHNPFARLMGLPQSVHNSNDSTVALGGDFEWHADYEVHRFGTPQNPPQQEANATFSLQGRGTYGTYGINIGYRKDRGPCFNVYHGHPHAGGYHFNMLTFPRSSATGKLSLRRQGMELVFLAADGLEEPLTELIRLPIRADLTPHLCFSSFQGTGHQPPDVDVTFSKMMLRADRILTGDEVKAVLPAAGPAKPFGVNLDYSQKPGRLMTDFKASGHSSQAFRLEGDGLRIHPPLKPAYDKKDNTYFFRESKFGIDGDFEIAWKYKMTAVGPFGRDGTGSASFSIYLRNESPVGHYGFSCGGSRNTPHRYGVTAEIPSKKGVHFDTQTFRTNAAEGRMIVRRIGSELTFLVQEPQDPAPRVLTRMPYMADRIAHVRIAAYQGANGTNVLDAKVSDFVIQAERLIDADTNQPIGNLSVEGNTVAEPLTLDALPLRTSNKWLYVKWVVMGFGVLLLLGGVYLIIQRRAR